MRRDRRRNLGRLLIWLGVLAWGPFAWLRYILHTEPEILPFLAVHLAGVIPGVLLVRWPLSGKTRTSGDRDAPGGGRTSHDRPEAT